MERSRFRHLSLVILILLGLFIGSSAWAQSDEPPMDSETPSMENPDADNITLSPGQEQVTSKIASQFVDFAGSEENAEALVKGLRTGTSITLEADDMDMGDMDPGDMDPGGMDMGDMDMGNTTDGVEIQNETAYGFGNVSHILTLAEAQLLDLGIENPTPEQIEAALRGGDITIGDVDNPETVTLEGILTMRESGMGYGEIAQALGTKLGHLKSAKQRAARSSGDDVAEQDDTDTDMDGEIGSEMATLEGRDKAEHGKPGKESKAHGKPDGTAMANLDKGPKFDRPLKVEKAERPQKPEKISRPERPEKVSRPERPEKPEKIARPEKPEKPERPGKS
jgi:hypothetical protein